MLEFNSLSQRKLNLYLNRFLPSSLTLFLLYPHKSPSPALNISRSSSAPPPSVCSHVISSYPGFCIPPCLPSLSASCISHRRKQGSFYYISPLPCGFPKPISL